METFACIAEGVMCLSVLFLTVSMIRGMLKPSLYGEKGGKKEEGK